MLTSILFHLLGNAPKEDGSRVSAHRCELPQSQAVPAGLSLASRLLSPVNMTGKEGNPSPGSSYPALSKQPCGTVLGNPTFPKSSQTCFAGCSACHCRMVSACNDFFLSVSPESETDVLLTKINSLMQE